MQQISIWEKESFFAPQDVIIVGSGFCGLWSAYYLKKTNPTLSITILEKGVIPVGASTRNAGFSCFGSPSELLSDAEKMGAKKMWQIVAQRYNGLQEIRKHFSDSEIDYDPSGGYECFINDDAIWQKCLSNLNWLNDGLEKITGIKNVFKIADDKINKNGFNGITHLIENKLEGSLHSGKLLKALLIKVQGLGVQVLSGIEVMNFTKKNNTVSIKTSVTNFTANQLLLCTNAFTKTLLPNIDIVPNRGQILITEPIENLSIKGTFHFDEGYYYFRNVGNRLLLGGARKIAFAEEQTTELLTTELIQNKLQEFIKKYLLPNNNFKIDYQWSGIMAMGKNEKLPIVESVSENIFCCVRMSGMGVALAPVAAKKITEMMCG